MNIASTPDAGIAHVLLVECNHLLHVELMMWLRQTFPRCRIDSADDHVQAAKLAAQHQPSAVLVNIDARLGAGFAALRAVHALELRLPLLAISQFPLEYFREPATKAGASHCVCVRSVDDALRGLLRGLLSQVDASAGLDASVVHGRGTRADGSLERRDRTHDTQDPAV